MPAKNDPAVAEPAGYAGLARNAALRAQLIKYDRLTVDRPTCRAVVHAIWSGRSLCIWGEDTAAAKEALGAAERRAGAATLRPHPFAVAAADLLVHLAQLGARVVDWGEIETDWLLDLALPTSAEAPVPSPRLVVEGRGESAGKPVALAGWTVPALVLPAYLALDWLAVLSSDEPPEVRTGSSIRYYAELAKVALQFAVRGRVLPAFEQVDGMWRTRWEPVPEPRQDAERLALLRAAQPPLARAEIFSTGAAGLKGGDPDALFDAAFSALVDAAVRDALIMFQEPWRRRGTRRQPTPSEHLLEALIELSGDPNSGELASAADLPRNIGLCRDQLQPWLEPARSAPQGAYRTCFRLGAPPDGPGADGTGSAGTGSDGKSRDGTGTHGPGSDGLWRLEFLLQAADDPSLQVSAQQIWAARGRTLDLVAGRIADPQERLLADLGRASRLYLPLERALKQARPTGLALETADAYEFLTEAGPVLESAGFGILVPPWWQKRNRQLGVRLKAEPKDSAAGSGLLGLEGLCAYEWEIALGERALSLAEFKALAALKVPLVQVRGEWVELRRDQIESAVAFFKRRQTGGEMSTVQVLRIGMGIDRSPAGLLVLGVAAEGWLGELLDGKSTEAIVPIATPAAFRGTLRPYQERGLSWLAFCDRTGLGACLADDMGLGKTIQLLALLSHERSAAVPGKGTTNNSRGKRSNGRGKYSAGRAEAPVGPTLLVAPMSVVGNWERETARFCPDLSVLVHHGTSRAAGDEFEALARRHDLVITTYNLAVRDTADLARVPWRRIVLDEAQNIKNHATRQAVALRSLPARNRVALSGTPVENRLAELWSIMDFLNPGLLGSREDFRTRFENPVERYRDADRAALLLKLIGPFVLRRKKTDRTIIQDLPDKLEMKVFCNLTREQATLYQAVVTDMLARIEQSEGIQRKGLVLATMLKLKQVCNHPAQFLQDKSAVAGRSGKLDRLEETLDEALALGDKALVFTQFAEMGHLLVTHLQQRLGRIVPFLHGGTPKTARDAMVTRFQESGEAPVLLLSLKAGGTGLNLTAANHVIHFDRWWNPAVEDQATDRAFRIGQTKNVQVRKFVCVGTLEERIDRMIEEKRDLAERVVGTGEGWLTELSLNQLRDLFVLAEAEAVGE